MRTILGVSVLLGAAALLGGGAAHAQAVDFANTNIETVKIADNLYVLMGGPAQGNIVVLTGGDGLFLVRTDARQDHGRDR